MLLGNLEVTVQAMIESPTGSVISDLSTFSLLQAAPTEAGKGRQSKLPAVPWKKKSF